MKRTLILLFFIMLTQVNAQYIKGTVVDSITQSPLKDVTVMVDNSKSLTDSLGVFNFENIPYGFVTVVAKSESYKSKAVVISYASYNNKVELKFELVARKD